MKRLLILTLFSLGVLSSHAQYQLDPNLSSMYIDGTSTLHDWTSTVEGIKGSLNPEIAEGKLSKIKSIHLDVAVNSIKSGKSAMDKNTYNALNESAHPNISFRLKTYHIDETMLTLGGDLTISGVTQSIKIRTPYSMTGEKIKIDGSYKLQMTDYNVEPPTAVMGTIKTGDDVTVRFHLVFVK